MATLKRAAAGFAAVAVTAPIIALTAAPAQADGREREGRCGTGDFNFSVERENRGFKVELDLDDLRPGQRWGVVLRHDGRVYTRVVRRADGDGDIEIDRWRKNTRGADTFKFRAFKMGGGPACTATIRFAR